eukprot:764976_1
MEYIPVHMPRGCRTIEELIDKVRVQKQSDGINIFAQNNGSSAEEFSLRARRAFAGYLWRWRTQASNSGSIDAELMIVVDTALLFLHVGLGEEEEAPFTLTELLFPQNNCFLSESEHFLTERKKYRTLGRFYHSKKNHAKALDVYHRLGTGEYSDGKCKGISESVSLLAEMVDERLLWKYSEWVL